MSKKRAHVSYHEFQSALVALGGTIAGANDWYGVAVEIGLKDTDTAESLAQLCLEDERANTNEQRGEK